MTPHEAIRLFAKTLENLEKWMDKAEEYAKDRGFEVDVLAQSRLAPDQYSFVKQVQSACDQAKYAAAYLSGGKPPSHPDTEQTFAELRAADPKSAEVRRERAGEGFRGRRRAQGGAAVARRPLVAARLPRRVAIPNFFFHATIAYAILRHNGVAARQDGLHRRAADAGGLMF